MQSWTNNILRVIKTILKKNKIAGLTKDFYKAYYKELSNQDHVVLIDISKKYRNTDQWIRLGSLEIDSKFTANRFWQSANAIYRDKDSILNKCYWNNWISTWRTKPETSQPTPWSVGSQKSLTWLSDVTETPKMRYRWQMLLLLFSRSVVSDSSATPWTIAFQAPLSLGFTRQQYWSGLPFPSPGDLPDWGDQICISCTRRWVLYRWATEIPAKPTDGKKKKKKNLNMLKITGRQFKTTAIPLPIRMAFIKKE